MDRKPDKAPAHANWAAANELLPLVYDQLRALARRELDREPSGLTLQPTALVHEVYLRLGAGDELKWENRRHFYGAAAIAMRRILIERARRHAGAKMGGGRQRVALMDGPADDQSTHRIDWLALNDALTAMERMDGELAEIVSLRFFAGLSLEQTAETIGVSLRTVGRSWNTAKAFLLDHMNGDPSETGAPRDDS